MTRHMTDEERAMIGQTVRAHTHWVWTEQAERIYPDRKAGEPVPQHHRVFAPKIWAHRRYIREASQEYQMSIFMEDELHA